MPAPSRSPRSSQRLARAAPRAPSSSAPRALPSARRADQRRRAHRRAFCCPLDPAPRRPKRRALRHRRRLARARRGRRRLRAARHARSSEPHGPRRGDDHLAQHLERPREGALGSPLSQRLQEPALGLAAHAGARLPRNGAGRGLGHHRRAPLRAERRGGHQHGPLAGRRAPSPGRRRRDRRARPASARDRAGREGSDRGRLGRQDAFGRRTDRLLRQVPHDRAVVPEDRAARAHRALGALSLSPLRRVLRRLRHLRRDPRRAAEVRHRRDGARDRHDVHGRAPCRTPRSEGRARFRLDGVGRVAGRQGRHRRRPRQRPLPAELQGRRAARAARHALRSPRLRDPLRPLSVRGPHSRPSASERGRSRRDGVPDADHDGWAVVRTARSVRGRDHRDARVRAPVVLRAHRHERSHLAVPRRGAELVRRTAGDGRMARPRLGGRALRAHGERHGDPNALRQSRRARRTHRATCLRLHPRQRRRRARLRAHRRDLRGAPPHVRRRAGRKGARSVRAEISLHAPGTGGAARRLP